MLLVLAFVVPFTGLCLKKQKMVLLWFVSTNRIVKLKSQLDLGFKAKICLFSEVDFKLNSVFSAFSLGRSPSSHPSREDTTKASIREKRCWGALEVEKETFKLVLKMEI